MLLPKSSSPESLFAKRGRDYKSQLLLRNSLQVSVIYGLLVVLTMKYLLAYEVLSSTYYEFITRTGLRLFARAGR